MKPIMKTVWKNTEREPLIRIRNSFSDQVDPNLNKQYWHKFRILDLNGTLPRVRNQIMDTIYQMLADELSDESSN